MWCCSAREGKKPPSVDDKVKLVDETPAPPESAPEQAPASLPHDNATKQENGSRWIDALLANPDELQTETQTRFRSIDSSGHMVSGGDGLVDEEEALRLISSLCDELDVVM